MTLELHLGGEVWVGREKRMRERERKRKGEKVK